MTSTTSASKHDREPVAQNGRKLGPRALKTRERLLDVTEALLRDRKFVDLSVVEIARKANTSPGTFYHYFQDVQEAALCLAERAAEEMPAVVKLIDGSWRGREGLDRARSIVEAFIDHWDEHHAVLSLRNLSSDLGDSRFQRVRRRSLAPVLNHFSAKIREGQEAGRIPAEVHADVAAAALAAILERLSAHYRSLKPLDVTRDDLIETCARMIYQTVTGRAPR